MLTRYLTSGYDKSGKTTANTQVIAERSLNRSYMRIQNVSPLTMRVSESDIPASTDYGYSLASGETFIVQTSAAITLWCAEAGHNFQVTER